MKHVLHSARHLWLAGMLAASLAISMGFALAGVASAHAAYDHSTPAAGAVLDTAPTQITVVFKENIDPKGSSLTVYHMADARNTTNFDQEAKQVSPANGTQYPLSDAKSMTIAMQGDGDGIYAVVWNTISADDGDPDAGVFFFGVSKGNVLGTSGASSTPTTSTTSTGTPIWVTILVGIVALVLGAVAAMALVGRRSSGSGNGGGPTGTPSAPDATDIRL